MRKSEVLLTLAVLAAAGTSLWLWTELRAERALHEHIARVDSSPAPAVPELAQVPQAQEPAPPPAPAKVSASADATKSQSARYVQGTQQDWEGYMRRLFQDPKYREAWRQQERLKYGPRRENVIRLLGFTPEQADAVIDLAVDEEIRRFDRTPPDPLTDEFRQQQAAWAAQDERELQAKLLELLGEEKRARFAEYLESRQSREMVDEFRSQLTGNESLRDDQAEPLIAALHVEQAQMRKELTEFRDTLSWEGYAPDSWRQYGERKIELLKAAHGRMHSAAAPILSRGQLERLDAMLKHELERNEARQRMERVQAKLDSGGQAASSTN